jgi:hypothetical protein
MKVDDRQAIVEYRKDQIAVRSRRDNAVDRVAKSMKQDDVLVEHRQNPNLSASPACHPLELRTRRAQLYAAPFSHPFFSAFHRSVRVPLGLVRDGLCCNSA